MCVTLSRQNMQNFLFCFFCQASSASFFRPRRSLSRPRSRSLGSLIPSFYAPSSGDSSESPPAPTVTLSDQSPPPERACFSTLAVAHRRLGPTSSASISTVDLVSPSGVSHDRDRSRPVTTTRLPLVRDSATFSASVRHAFARKYEVSPSFHWPEASWYRLLTAIRKFATAAPFGVYRSSGSSTRFPTMTTWFPLAMSIPTLFIPSSGRWPAGRRGSPSLCSLSNDLEPDDLVREGQHPIELGQRVRLGLERDEDVDPLRSAVDLVGKLPASHPVDVRDLTAAFRQDLRDPVHDATNLLFVGVGTEDRHDLILPQTPPPLVCSAPRGSRGGRQILAPALPYQGGVTRLRRSLLPGQHSAGEEPCRPQIAGRPGPVARRSGLEVDVSKQRYRRQARPREFVHEPECLSVRHGRIVDGVHGDDRRGEVGGHGGRGEPLQGIERLAGKPRRQPGRPLGILVAKEFVHAPQRRRKPLGAHGMRRPSTSETPVVTAWIIPTRSKYAPNTATCARRPASLGSAAAMSPNEPPNENPRMLTGPSTSGCESSALAARTIRSMSSSTNLRSASSRSTTNTARSARAMARADRTTRGSSVPAPTAPGTSTMAGARSPG